MGLDEMLERIAERKLLPATPRMIELAQRIVEQEGEGVDVELWASRLVADIAKASD